jgi:hypothetical protein
METAQWGAARLRAHFNYRTYVLDFSLLTIGTNPDAVSARPVLVSCTAIGGPQ